MKPAIISEENFRELATERIGPLMCVINCLCKKEATVKFLNRLCLSELLSQSTSIEEFLDSYGAKNNLQWSAFRSLIATIKLFSDVSYELLHIKHGCSRYRLLDIGHDFVGATEEAFTFTRGVLFKTFPLLQEQVENLKLDIRPDDSKNKTCVEGIIDGVLSQDSGSRHVETAAETVTLLATSFLNLSVAGEVIHDARRVEINEHGLGLSEILSEKKLRSLELEFHNLQSIYDTNVSDTDVESLDSNLPVLRGHISVVFHLLRTATDLAHYYERHVSTKRVVTEKDKEPLVDSCGLLGVLMDYSITYASRYITSAKELCHTMLKEYAEVGEIEVSVPRYRGFHVRPSTLVSKIVLHYGSNIQMQLDEDKYDASSPLELFRANEKINANKRCFINQEIVHTDLIPAKPGERDIKDIVRDIVMTLVGSSKLLLYEQPLKLRKDLGQDNKTLLHQVIDEITRLQATGKIDIETDLKVKFVGDKRVLADIKLLAESGYGEDNFGNNIQLPDELKYLRR